MQTPKMLGDFLLGPNDTPENGIYCGDARELAKAIPDESVDLIFTDPVYQNIDDYRWLAETAARVLKPDSACLAWCSNIKQYDVKNVMDEYLTFVMPLIYTAVGKTYRLFGYNIYVWSTPCLWFSKGNSRFIKRTIDTVQSGNRSSAGHKWNKNPEAYFRWLRDMTNEHNIVIDFFAGGGTAPAVCKQLGRNYLAFEIDPDTCALARERVRNTQPPLFVTEPEQLQMDIRSQT